ALGISPERTINLYPRYANIGPVFLIANLYHAAQSGRLRENDLVLVYTNGAGATAGAMIMRWGNVALGEVPAPPRKDTLEQEAIHLAEVDFAEESDTEAASLTKQQLLAAKPGARQQMLEAYLLEWLGNSLRLSPNELSAQQSFSSLLDSLLALVFRSQIESDFGLQVPMEDFFGDNTIARLAEQLLDRLLLEDLTVFEPVDIASPCEEERDKLSI
ncbi:MAG: 3-oxoacyl-[acyl-carrier-protein] synthase III C-terminal domain-containing protein, partial [Cyanobacteria bacterium P01_A01_bin.40]